MYVDMTCLLSICLLHALNSTIPVSLCPYINSPSTDTNKRPKKRRNSNASLHEAARSVSLANTRDAYNNLPGRILSSSLYLIKQSLPDAASSLTTIHYSHVLVLDMHADIDSRCP